MAQEHTENLKIYYQTIETLPPISFLSAYFLKSIPIERALVGLNRHKAE